MIINFQPIIFAQNNLKWKLAYRENIARNTRKLLRLLFYILMYKPKYFSSFSLFIFIPYPISLLTLWLSNWNSLNVFTIVLLISNMLATIDVIFLVWWLLYILFLAVWFALTTILLQFLYFSINWSITFSDLMTIIANNWKVALSSPEVAQFSFILLLKSFLKIKQNMAEI